MYMYVVCQYLNLNNYISNTACITLCIQEYIDWGLSLVLVYRHSSHGLSLLNVGLKPPRKSNCVKEVERLKKNREERRLVKCVRTVVIVVSTLFVYSSQGQATCVEAGGKIISSYSTS